MAQIRNLVEDEGLRAGHVREVPDRVAKAKVASGLAEFVAGSTVTASMSRAGDEGRPGLYGGQALRTPPPSGNNP